MRKLAILAGLFTIPSVSNAGAFQDGNQLYEVCKMPDSPYCRAYIVGVADHAAIDSATSEICLKNNVTQGQISDVAVKWLQDHPQDRHYSAASLVRQALSKAFPCPSK